MNADHTDQERSGDLVIARDRVIGKLARIVFQFRRFLAIPAILAIFPFSVSVVD